MDIIVTTPKAFRGQAAEEAQRMIDQGGGEYFRRLPIRPDNFKVGDKVWYIEDGYIRGYAVSTRIEDCSTPQICSTTGKVHDSGFYIYLDAKSWKWVYPVARKGFQGWAYFDPLYAKTDDYTVSNMSGTEVGGWLDPMPKTPADIRAERQILIDAALKNVTPDRIKELNYHLLKNRRKYFQSLGISAIQEFLSQPTLWDKLRFLSTCGVELTDKVICKIVSDCEKEIYQEIEKSARAQLEGEAMRSVDSSLPRFIVGTWWYDSKKEQFAKISSFDVREQMYYICWAETKSHRYDAHAKCIDTMGGDAGYFSETNEALSEFTPAYEGIDFNDCTDYD